MRYQVKIYVGTHFPYDEGTNVSINITADSEDQARERAISLMPINMDVDVYETREIK